MKGVFKKTQRYLFLILTLKKNKNNFILQTENVN
jgi:hypothetical protein